MPTSQHVPIQISVFVAAAALVAAIPGHDRACRAFEEDLSHLNMLEPTMWCRATNHIPEQIEAIQCIEAKGLTYRTADAIYFDTSKLHTYGEVARLNIKGLHAVRRMDMGGKRHPRDLALWKISPPD
jgi:cysteinyl-tRNA synthetase